MLQTQLFSSLNIHLINWLKLTSELPNIHDFVDFFPRKYSGKLIWVMAKTLLTAPVIRRLYFS